MPRQIGAPGFEPADCGCGCVPLRPHRFRRPHTGAGWAQRTMQPVPPWYFTIPEIVFEASFAIYLIVKGFRRRPFVRPARAPHSGHVP